MKRVCDGDGGAGGDGGISIAAPAQSASLINTIVGPNLGGPGGAGGSPGYGGAPDLRGYFNSLGHNLIGRKDGTAGFTNGVKGDLAGSADAPIDPLLGPLMDNGGPTHTMALLHGSPDLDAGDDALLRPPYALRTDQRNLRRKSGSHVDIGAFEFQFREVPHSSAHAQILSATLLLNGDLQSNTASRSFQLAFRDNTPGATFTVLATTNLFLPLNNWNVLGQPIQIRSGVFQLIDVQTTNNLQRFYRVSAP